MYHIARKALFTLDPEISHNLSLDWLSAAERLRLLGLFAPDVPLIKTKVMGIEFPNPVGLAAGLDKNADHINALGALGFGFLEVGTVTPEPQAGNPKPRLFRLPDYNAIINRMGFNNKGVEHLVEQVRKPSRFNGVLGINIGKNKTTPEENALDDYLCCLEQVYDYADYITVNISSPNTPGLRDLQFGESLNTLLKGIKQRQAELADQHDRYVPIAVKIAPDMDSDEIASVAATLVDNGIDGVIATNTTVSRDGVGGSVFADEAGGLSGQPVRDKSTEVIRELSRCLDGKLPIIGVGGIMSGGDAVEKLRAGASLVQVYSGFIYYGPKLIQDIAQEILAYNRYSQ